MYSAGCRNGQSTSGAYNLYRGSTLIDQFSFSDNLGYGYTYYQSLSAGNYTLVFKPTWTQYDAKDYTVSLYAADQVYIYDDQGKTSNVTFNLLNSLTQALSNVNAFPYENGGWYYTRKGWIGTNNDTYFYQYGGPTNLYNMNITMNFTSFNPTAVTTVSGNIQKFKNSDGSISLIHLCQIQPKQNINDCAYMVNVNKSIKVDWTLKAWNYA